MRNDIPEHAGASPDRAAAGGETSAGNKAFERVVQLIDGACVVGLGLLTLVGFLILGHEKNYRPLVFGWSGPYLLLVLVQLFLLAFFQMLALSSPGLRSWLFLHGPWRRRVGMAFLCVLCLSDVWLMPYPYARVLSAFLMLMLLCLLSRIWFSRPELMLTYFVLAAVGFTLFLFELPGLNETRRPHSRLLADWGDETTFHYMFPRSPPFIGPGGRLQSSVRCRLARPPWEEHMGVWFATNHLGFRNDEEFDEAEESNQFRILSLGDSFSIGLGIEQGKFFGPRLQKRLGTRLADRHVLVMNAEVSDPAYGLYYLQCFGMKYSPKVVLYGLSCNDTIQTTMATSEYGPFFLDSEGNLAPKLEGPLELPSNFAWGDVWKDYAYPLPGNSAPDTGTMAAKNETFLWNDLVQFRSVAYLLNSARTRLHPPERTAGELTKPSLRTEAEELDGHKRFFDASPNLGFFYRGRLQPAEEIYATFFRVLKSLDDTTRRAGALFVLIYYPQRHQVQPQDWQVLQERWNLQPEDFDLDLDNRRIGEFCKSQNINFCDLSAAFRVSAVNQNLYLPYDTHINEAGHELAAEEVETYLLELLRMSRDR